MRDVMEFKVDLAYSVSKPTRMLEQKSRVSNPWNLYNYDILYEKR